VVEGLVSQPPPNGPRAEVKDLVRGYAAGYNRYLRDTGVGHLPDPGCRGQPWVRPIEEIDVYRRFYQLALLASTGVALDGIGGAQPPTPPGSGSHPPTPPAIGDFEALEDRLPLGGIGSNAYGFGRDKTDNGKGLLLGNPHFPWDGAERFYQAHLTIPGRLDVSGGSLFGVPLVLIGHTRGLAWSHTVSTAFRFTPFEVALVPGSPTTYLVDGQPREMTRDEVTVQARRPDASLEPRTRTLYSTAYGPVFTSLLGQPLFPWTPARAFALGDANAANFRYLNHFLETNLAQSTRDYDAVLRRNQGIPWVNSIGADSRGDAYYADISVVPHATDAHAQRCNTALGAGTFELLRLPILDGSRSACAWGRDADAVQPGTFGPAHSLPSLFRRDYVHNGNDSYWLTNPEQPLTGFARIIGDENTERTLRTRIGLIMARDGLFSLRRLQDTVFNNRQYAGELWRDAAVAMCRSQPVMAGTSGPVDVREACDVLAAWDVRDDPGSRGAILFRRFAERALDLPGGGFSQPYSPADPVNTPRGLRTEDPAVRRALADAVKELRDLRIPLDGRLADFQTEGRGDERIPIHGGPGAAGVFNSINVVPSDMEAGKGYTNVGHGSSFVQAVQFVDGACPVEPRTILSYSQSTNPSSPFFADQTRMYARKEWNDVPFCPDEVRAATLSTTRLHEGRDACVARSSLGAVSARRRGRGVRVRWAGGGAATVDVLHGRRRVARLRGRRSSVAWNGRGARRDGVYVLRVRSPHGDVRRLAVRRRSGRLRVLPAFERASACGRVRSFRLARPTFRRALRVSYRLDARRAVTLRVLRGRDVVRTIRRRAASGRLRLPARRLRPGVYRVQLRVGRARVTLGSLRL
jgi:acyl-homoserine-lactone acylase